MNFLNFMLETTIESFKFYRAVMELSMLSDKELNEIGLTRGEIVTAVYKAQISNK